MDLRVKHSLETRIEVARLFDAGFGFHAIATQLGLSRESVRNWHDQYVQGRLLDSAVMGNKKYSPQLKIAAVEKFLSGTVKQDVLVEFDISTRSLFDKWVATYRDEGPEGLSKTAGRKARGDGPMTPEEELAFLRMENEILKKMGSSSPGGRSTAFRSVIVTELEHKYPTQAVLKAVGLSSATYYRHRSKPVRADHYSQARSLITGKYSDGFLRVYGYRRIRNDFVKDYGMRISPKTVLKLMHEEGRLSRIRKKKPYSSHRGEQGHTAENVVARNFEASKPQRKWVTDVTEFYVLGQKQYLSPVVDLFNREVISYALASTPAMGLVTAMLEKAFTRLEPGAGLVMHSDQGWHYRHRSYQHALASRGIVQSMSRKGNCHDNAVAENFFSHFKEEFLRQNTFSSMAEFTMKLDRWIHWFNHERTQEKLKGLSPVDYRTQSLANLETTPY